MQPYVTKAEVYAAADAVDAKGKMPSADTVHAVIGEASEQYEAATKKEADAKGRET
jgi:hypothetical protein